MRDTAELILDTAQDLIQTKGFSAMSFQDVADRVGIKKPSIIHHFPSKHALGVAVIRRYREGLAGALDSIKDDPDKNAGDALEFYFSPYLEFAGTPNKVCLCGALAGEIMAVPPEMRDEVRRFFEGHQRWLEDILAQGREQCLFHLCDEPHHLARLYFGALQGALLVKRTTGDLSQVSDVVQSIRKSVEPK